MDVTDSIPDFVPNVDADQSGEAVSCMHGSTGRVAPGPGGECQRG